MLAYPCPLRLSQSVYRAGAKTRDVDRMLG